MSLTLPLQWNTFFLYDSKACLVGRKQKQQAEAARDKEVMDDLQVTMGMLTLINADEYEVKRRMSPPKPYLVRVGDSVSADDTCKALSKAAQESYLRYTNGTPSHGHLTTVIHYNVFHGLARNATLMGLQNEWIIKGTTSPFNQQSPAPRQGDLAASSWPENLRPTPLQRVIMHHPWIDLFPLPRMRDNFLRALSRASGSDRVNEDGLCRDIVDVGAGEGVDKAALVVWGEPWDPRSWEATEMFLTKWGWILEGCTEVLEATNYWRKKRGLRPFRFKES